MNNINAILTRKVCIGCGACTVVCPEKCISIIKGKRYNYPTISESDCTECGKCLKVCPSNYLINEIHPENIPIGLKDTYHYFLIHATDDEIRLDAASGGTATALMIYLLENKIIKGAIVSKCDSEHPLESITFIARTREDLLEARASRYTPTSCCPSLQQIIDDTDGKYVFVAKPCELDALEKLKKYYPILNERILFTIGPICAGTASRSSTKAFLDRYNVDVSKVKKICYRGDGWPGTFRAYDEKDNLIIKRPLLGDELRHLVPRDHYLRCHLCLDQWAAHADISISDPWCDEFVKNEKKGRTAIVVRSQKALDFVNEAIDKGILLADSITKEDIQRFQPSIVKSIPLKKSWLASYSIIFHKRFRNLSSFIKFRARGLKTCFESMRNNDYYEVEN